MNMIRLFNVILIVMALFVLTLQAEETNKNGTTAAQFLKIGVGARAMGMGGAMVGSADDAFSLYWNPAGITKVKSVTLAGTHTQWFADIIHQFMGLVIPVNRSSAVGFHATVLNMDEMEITTVDQPHGTGEFFDAQDIAIGATFGIKLTNFFALGLTGKFIQQTIYNESASTFAFDIGSLLDIPLYGMRMGMNFSNFGGKMRLDGRDLTREYDLNPNNTLNVGVETRLKTEPWELPVNFRVGLAIDLLGPEKSFRQSEHSRFTLTVDGNHPTDAEEYLAFGGEYAFREVLALRGGYRLNRDVEKFFYGIGLNVPVTGATFNFDYALASFGELDYIQVFSVALSF
ncbi:MAG: type IX secretion system outer membrane channel protein PorV [Calditrichia bacterium]